MKLKMTRDQGPAKPKEFAEPTTPYGHSMKAMRLARRAAQQRAIDAVAAEAKLEEDYEAARAHRIKVEKEYHAKVLARRTDNKNIPGEK